MKTVALLALLFAGIARAEPCLEYRPLTLQGSLSEQTFAGPPNYESIAAGDAAESYFFIALPRPTCVTRGTEVHEPAVASIQRFQLIFAASDAHQSYDRLRPHLGKNITCTGDLWGRNTGHHHSEVMLLNAVCHAT